MHMMVIMQDLKVNSILNRIADTPPIARTNWGIPFEEQEIPESDPQTTSRQSNNSTLISPAQSGARPDSHKTRAPSYS
jgi:hypothetical protein